MVGYFLPCKVVVYQDGDKTKVGMPRPTALIQMVNVEAIKEVAGSIENGLISFIDKAI